MPEPTQTAVADQPANQSAVEIPGPLKVNEPGHPAPQEESSSLYSREVNSGKKNQEVTTSRVDVEKCGKVTPKANLGIKHVTTPQSGFIPGSA